MRGSWVFIFPIVGLLSSCFKNNAVADQTATQFTNDTTAISVYLKQIPIEATKLPQGIWFIIDSAAVGIRATFNDSVKLKYTTRLLTDNSIVNQVTTPKYFFLDSLIAGVQIGLSEFQAGSKGRIFIPSYYSGTANLIFEFQLMEVKDYQLKLDIVTIDNYLSSHSINATQDASGIRYTIDTLKAGGRPLLMDDIQINYNVKDLSDGSFVDQGTSMVFPLSSLILGLKIGLQNISEGSTATFYLPSSLCYGPRSSGKTIKANANLIYNIKLQRIIHP